MRSPHTTTFPAYASSAAPASRGTPSHSSGFSRTSAAGGRPGEPWNPEPFQWFFKNIGGGRIPVINYTGGTEISGGILCGNVISPLRPCSFAGPMPGIAAVVLDAEGNAVRGEVGELAIRNPWA